MLWCYVLYIKCREYLSFKEKGMQFSPWVFRLSLLTDFDQIWYDPILKEIPLSVLIFYGNKYMSKVCSANAPASLFNKIIKSFLCFLHWRIIESFYNLLQFVFFAFKMKLILKFKDKYYEIQSMMILKI